MSEAFLPKTIDDAMRIISQCKFEPMKECDWDSFMGAEEGTLICYLNDVLCVLKCPDGSYQIFNDDCECVQVRLVMEQLT